MDVLWLMRILFSQIGQADTSDRGKDIGAVGDLPGVNGRGENPLFVPDWLNTCTEQCSAKRAMYITIKSYCEECLTL
jgi:hypothetical protein